MQHESEHTSREVLQQFFRTELSRREAKRVVRHLLAQCPDCLALALEVGENEGVLHSVRAPHRASPFAPSHHYEEIFLRLQRNANSVEAELARERPRSLSLWAYLKNHPQDRRLIIIRNNPRMHTWSLYGRLLEKSREMSFRDPIEAANLAHLALAVVDKLDPMRYGQERIADFRAGALAALGNAQRLASEFAAAKGSFQDAWEILSQGTGDPMERANLISLRSSLHKDLGEFEEAVRLTDQEISIFRRLNAPHLEGRALLRQAAIVGLFDPEKGTGLAEAGLALIDSFREPRLEMCGLHSLAHFLNDTGQSQRARSILEASRPIFAQFDDSWTQIRLLWLEGKIARSHNDLAGAEEMFRKLTLDLQETDYAQELALVSLDLAEVYVARGKYDEASRLAAEFRPVLRFWGMHTEDLAMWLLIQKAA